MPVAARHHQRLAQAQFEGRRDHEAQHQRRRIEIELAKQVADHAHDQHDPDVDDGVVHLVDADDAEHDDQRIEIVVADAQHVHEQADQRQIQRQQHQVADVHRGDEAPEHLRVIVHQRRPGRNAVQHQCGDQHRGHRAGRNAERQHRHERPGGGGVVCRFRPGDAGDRALAELLGVLRDPLLDGIGQEARNDVRGARHDADQEAQHGAAPDRGGRRPPLLAVRQQLAEFRPDQLALHVGAGPGQDFAEPEQSDRHRHDADAVAQLLDVEAVAEMAGHHVDADGAEQQPERRHQQRAHQRGRRHVGEEDQAEHQQRGVFRRAEAQREVRERRRHHRQRDHAERAGDERAHRRDAERRAGAALLRHGVTVDAGHHRGGFAGDAQQDRRGRAAVLRAVVDAGQHDDGLGRVEAVGDRQEDADAGERADPRQHADQRADEAAEEGVPQHVRPERDREAEQQRVEDGFHGGSEPEQAPLQRGLERVFERRVDDERDRNGRCASEASRLRRSTT